MGVSQGFRLISLNFLKVIVVAAKIPGLKDRSVYLVKIILISIERSGFELGMPIRKHVLNSTLFELRQ